MLTCPENGDTLDAHGSDPESTVSTTETGWSRDRNRTAGNAATRTRFRRRTAPAQYSTAMAVGREGPVPEYPQGDFANHSRRTTRRPSTVHTDGRRCRTGCTRPLPGQSTRRRHPSLWTRARFEVDVARQGRTGRGKRLPSRSYPSLGILTDFFDAATGPGTPVAAPWLSSVCGGRRPKTGPRTDLEPHRRLAVVCNYANVRERG